MVRIFKDSMVKYLNENNGRQQGFTKSHSCFTNQLEFAVDAYERRFKGKLVDVVYLDFAKHLIKYLM